MEYQKKMTQLSPSKWKNNSNPDYYSSINRPIQILIERVIQILKELLQLNCLSDYMALNQTCIWHSESISMEKISRAESWDQQTWFLWR